MKCHLTHRGFTQWEVLPPSNVDDNRQMDGKMILFYWNKLNCITSCRAIAMIFSIRFEWWGPRLSKCIAYHWRCFIDTVYFNATKCIMHLWQKCHPQTMKLNLSWVFQFFSFSLFVFVPFSFELSMWMVYLHINIGLNTDHCNIDISWSHTHTKC